MHPILWLIPWLFTVAWAYANIDNWKRVYAFKMITWYLYIPIFIGWIIKKIFGFDFGFFG